MSDDDSSVAWSWDGELDAGDVAALRTAWSALGDQHPASVTLDLARVTFLDCAVLGLLIAMNTSRRPLLVLQNPSAATNRLLQCTGTARQFTTTGTSPTLEPPTVGGSTATTGATAVRWGHHRWRTTAPPRIRPGESFS